MAAEDPTQGRLSDLWIAREKRIARLDTRRAAEVATDVMLRFLMAVGTLSHEDAMPLGGPDFGAHPRQRVIEVTEAITITGAVLAALGAVAGLALIERAGAGAPDRR